MICEILHIVLQKIYSTDHEITSQENLTFQAYTTDTQIHAAGYVYQRDYINLSNSLIINIDKDWSTYSDFKQARQTMKAQVGLIGWTNLKDFEKKIAAKWFVVSSDLQQQVMTFEEIKMSGLFFDSNSKASRQTRWDNIENFIRQVLPLDQIFNIIGAIQDLKNNYLWYGIEGTSSTNLNGVNDPTGIIDYLNSTSAFVGAGFLEQNTTPNFGYTAQEVRDKIIDAILNGNYI